MTTKAKNEHAEHVKTDSRVWDEAAGVAHPVSLCSCGAVLEREPAEPELEQEAPQAPEED
jgi:hypothetical protein